MRHINSTLVKLFLSSLIILFVSACSMHWTDAIKKGEITQNNFTESVDIEVQNGLIFLPVNINGKSYNFLFDSGAPLSISEQLQEELNFKVISEGTIKDSDHNRKGINWVEVGSLSIGGVEFKNQSAFVGDFQANPILKCLKIDGIIGSNIQRQCNWTINQENMTISFSDLNTSDKNESTVVIPFRSDNQYNMFVNLEIGRASIKNVLIDYGSNGSLALSNSVLNTLKENAIIENTISEVGYQQSGIIGKPVKSDREFTLTDSLQFNNYQPEDVYIRTGKTVSIGNKFLARYKVEINWDEQKLYLTEQVKDIPPLEFAGFKLSYSESRGIYVQAVIESSNAYKAGVRPLMKVTKLNDMNFEAGADFCEYLEKLPKENLQLEVVDDDGKKQIFKFEKIEIKG